MTHPRFLLFEQHVTVACETSESGSALGTVFGAFASSEERTPGPPVLSYTFGLGTTGEFLIRRGDEDLPLAQDTGMLLFRFEQDLVVELQKRRSDLYFLHAAVLERDGRAVLLLA